ncbi:MAG: transcriptional regulator with GAF, ATPase, and Fis domain, partial [Cyclobacteriaceae bacterium]
SILRYAKDTSIHEWPELTDRIQLIEAMRMCDNNQSKVAILLKSSPATISRKCARYSLDDGCRSFSPLPDKP